MNKEEFLKATENVPKTDSINSISAYNSINVEDLANAVERFKKIPTYDELLKENKILKENAEHNDKVVDKVNWENMLLKKENEQLKEKLDKYENPEDMTLYSMWCTEKIKDENQELKKQVEEYQQELEKADSITQSCIFNGKKESEISFRKCLNMLEKHKNQQKEFIKYLEGEIYSFELRGTSPEYNFENVLKRILLKYKEIIGDDK